MSNKDTRTAMDQLLDMKLKTPIDTAKCAGLAAAYLLDCFDFNRVPDTRLLQMCVKTLQASETHLLELVKAASEPGSGKGGHCASS